MNVFKKLTALLLDIFYPRVCVGCEQPMPASEPGFLCSDCYGRLRLIREGCEVCGAPVGKFTDTTKGCPICEKFSMRFEAAIAVSRFDGLLRDMVHKFKYGGDRTTGRALAQLIAQFLTPWEKLPDVSAVCAVPMHRKDLIRRGFNPAAMLARLVARSLNLPLMKKLLLKTRRTPSQTSLSGKARIRNVRGVFSTARRVDAGALLLVDDVMTTGATVSECTRELKKAGARRVLVAVVGRGGLLKEESS